MKFWSYDFIYPKIEEECLIPYLLQKSSKKKKKNSQTLNLHINDFVKEKTNTLILEYPFLRCPWKYFTVLGKGVPSGGVSNVVGKFRVFYHKNEMQNSVNIQSRRNQTFTGDYCFKRSYIRFVPTIMIINI